MRLALLPFALLLPLCNAAVLLQLNVGGGTLDGGILADTGEYRVNPAELFDNQGVTPYSSTAVALGSDLIYRFPVPSGTRIKVTAQFTETWDGAFAQGVRVMDVYIGGYLAWDDLDVFAEVGANVPFDVSHVLTVVDDAVEVAVTPIAENPMLSGVIIESIDDGGEEVLETQPGDNVVTEEISVMEPAVEEVPTIEAGNVTEPVVEDVPAIEEGNVTEPVVEDVPAIEEGNVTEPLIEEDPAAEDGESSDLLNTLTMPSTTEFAILNVSGTEPPARHENCGVFCNGKYYLIGGRFYRGAYAFDPVEGIWSEVQNPWLDLHHGQCLCIDNRIYVAGAWHGEFPIEQTYEEMAVYDTDLDSWSWDLPNPPGERLRGSPAVGASGSLIFMAGGSTGGHGNTTKMSNYTDMFDTANPEEGWKPLPDMPDARDHTGGAVVGKQFCVAGGRNGSEPDMAFWKLEANFAPIYCLDLELYEWKVMADLPNPRAGVAVAATCDGYLMVAGGEVRLDDGTEMAYDKVDLFDPVSNTFLEPLTLTSPRHGTGLGVTDCSCGNIYIGAGSASLGGGPELNSTEVWAPTGSPRKC